MTHQTVTSIDGGSAEYWKQRTEAFRLIHDAEDCAKRLETAPLYLHGGYDEDGDVIPVENLEPHDDMEDAVRAIEANETAVSILVAQRRTRIGGRPITEVILAVARLEEDPIEDPVNNPLWGLDTD